MQYDSQRFNRPSPEQQTKGEIEQYFGNGNVFEQQQRSGGASHVKPTKKVPRKDPFAMMNKIEHVPVHKSKGYLIFGVVMGVLLIVFLFQMEWMNALNALTAGGLSIWMMKK